MTMIDDAKLQESQVTLSKLDRGPESPGKVYVQVWLKSAESAWSGLLSVKQAQELSELLSYAAEQAEHEARAAERALAR
jgi:hypothetical protein